ncbi:MAG: hypothetical protein B6I22_13150 [Desulfobacteraceae bacterium 4572_123]|nr:MAG: hypothetical protein B6I22_13150 [Desulfobacteraceae bacterium 4572_123]
MTIQKPYITIDAGDLPAFAPVFQKGFHVEIVTGCSVRVLLHTQWELSDVFIDRRISTLFIDGKPVDDLDTAVVEEGATLAMSCAMPGLVGAVMRRGGLLSSFRSGITYMQAENRDVKKRGYIQVKLFNMLIKELGPAFLKGGIRMDMDDLAPVLMGKYSARLQHHFEKIWIRLDI